MDPIVGKSKFKMVHSVKAGLFRYNRNILINIITFVRLLHGFYSDLFCNFLWIHRVVRIYYILLTCLVIYCDYLLAFIYANYKVYFTYLYLYKLAEQSFNMLISIITNNENFTHFCSLVSTVDPLISEQSKNLNGIQTFFIFTFLYTSNISLQVISSLKIGKPLNALSFFVIFCIINMNLSYLTRIAMFDILRQKMKALKQIMQSQISSNNQNDIDNNDQMKHIKKCISAYNTLLGSLSCIGHSSKFLVLMNLCTPLIIIFIMINAIPFHGIQKILTNVAFDIIIGTILPFVPAVYGALIGSNVTDIKNMLSSKLTTTKDVMVRDKLRDVLTFLELQPFTVTVWRVYALDQTLPTSMVNLYTTFFIVMVQFKHINILN